MENFSTSTIVILIALALGGVALVVWLMYRNMKDAKNFEKYMDNPKREMERDKGDKT